MHHFYVMAVLHKENRYDRQVPTVEQITGVKPMSVKEWVSEHSAEFQKI
jgi:hypothetical protein